MLTENDVVKAVCSHLGARGYQVKQGLTTTQRGRDIIAVKVGASAVELHVEAKGETSNLKSSARYGKGFNSAQVRDHVANAFYTAACMLEQPTSPSFRAGIALPQNRLHETYVGRIRQALQRLQIAVFWVAPDRSVQVEAPWPI